MIAAPLHVTKGDRKSLWGVFQFAALPSPGDRINITDHAGRVQRLTVAHVTHEPVLFGASDSPARHPAVVHADWIDEF